MFRRAVVTAVTQRVAARSTSRSAAAWTPLRLSAGANSQRARWMSSVDVPPPPTSNHEHTPLSGAQGSIIYTETDEAPALATYSLYPVIQKVREKYLHS